MARTIRVAAIKMDATPAPKAERLKRAEALIIEAASAGAQLIVLPEVFNAGYEYHENNYALPESINGETVTWMKALAQEKNIHISGSLLILDGKDVYNSQILVAPDGRRWRYDKNYPWLFERAYFRDGSETMIAHTDLGKFGMMISWDYAHPELWQRYAGQVDAMLVTSSPPQMTRFTIIMPDGSKVDSRALGPFVRRSYHGDDEPFGKDFDEHVKWLGVPAVNTSASGEFRSYIPNPRIPVLLYVLFRPDLWRHVRKAHDVEIIADYYNQTKVVSATGEIIAQQNEAEGFALTDIDLADETPAKSLEPQPELPYSSLAYFFADVLAQSLMEKSYREGVRRQWGQKMAPFQRSVRWTIVIGLGAIGVLAAILRTVGHMTSGRNKVG